MNDKEITFCSYEDFKRIVTECVKIIKELAIVVGKAVQCIFKAYISSFKDYKKINHLAYKCKKQRIRNKNKKRLLIYYGTLTAI